MAMNLPEGTSVRDVLGKVSEFYVRNILKWRVGRGYGIRLMLTKAGSPTNLFVVSMTHSPKDPKWVSLCRALGIPHDDLDARRGVLDALLQKDLLTIINPGNSRKLTFASAVSGNSSPGPFFLSQMTSAQRVFLGGAIDVAIVANDAELGLLGNPLPFEDPLEDFPEDLGLDDAEG